MRKILFSLALFPLAAGAQVEYDYTSGPIDQVNVDYGTTAPQLGESITGIITLGQGLPPNGTTQVAPESVSFSAGGESLVNTAQSGLYLNGTFTFTTQDGLVTGFNFSQVTPWQYQNVFGIWSDSSTDAELETAAWYAYAPSGIWTDPPATNAPEIDPASTTSALLLLLGSLACLRGRRL